jgi:hypothetical protein
MRSQRKSEEIHWSEGLSWPSTRLISKAGETADTIGNPEPGKRPPCGAARPQPSPSFLHQSKWVRGGEFQRCSAPGSQNSQKGATLCSEFGKHR